MAVLEDGPDLHGERLAASVAFVEANSVAFAFKRRGTFKVATMRANAAIRPNARFDIGVSGGFVVEMRGGENGPRHGELFIESNILNWVGHVKYSIANVSRETRSVRGGARPRRLIARRADDGGIDEHRLAPRAAAR